MKKAVLLGAGFSANWGAPLANEVQIQLANDDEIFIDRNIRTKLRTDRAITYESLLAELEKDIAKWSEKEPHKVIALRDQYDRIIAGLHRLFVEVNKQLQEVANANESGMGACSRFFGQVLHSNGDPPLDVFTLNQDMLLEKILLPAHRATCSGVCFRDQEECGWFSDKRNIDINLPVVPRAGANERSDACILVHHLHGCSTWMGPDESPIIVAGGGKSHKVESQEVLKELFTRFVNFVDSPKSRLLVIGYSFCDENINCPLIAAVERGTLEIAWWNPYASSDFGSMNAGLKKMEPFIKKVFTTPVSALILGDQYPVEERPAVQPILRWWNS